MLMINAPFKIALLTSLFALFSLSAIAADLEINFCPVSKIQAGKQWNATIEITNNTNLVLNMKDGILNFNWQNLESLPYPFTSWSKNGKDVEFSVEGVSNWKSELPVGATWSKAFAGATFSGVLSFPTNGTFTFNGIEYTVAVNHCSKTEPYELYDAKFDFNRNCFIKSPTSDMCLGEAGTEIWQGEGVFDAMFPQDRPSWAIGTMVAHRLFTNLAGVDMLSPNFWTATAMNESRMTCDPTIVPKKVNHFNINGQPNTGAGVYSATDNCFQVLNIGYSQIENNQPDLFGQTNTYGTASYSTVISGGRYETGALAVTAYHYQDIRYWNQIFCWNAKKFHKEAKDPYAVEKVFYHAFHDGPNAGISLLNDIDANYTAAVNATDMHSEISTGGTWSNLGGGSSRKVANFTSLLDGGDGKKYNYAYNDDTQEYYGCYSAEIKWTDILYYLDKIKILYPDLMLTAVQADIKAVFDGLAGGGDISFSNLGPVIDEIVIKMGGHDPSGYLATQYSASKVCTESPLGVSLRTSDTLCPGEEGTLEVWLAGDKNYGVDIKFPDGSIHVYTNIDQSPFSITITQPGDYEVVYFEDADEVGDPDCNFANVTVESKNGSVVGWDKANVDLSTTCATGDLIINKTGNESVTISYTKDGAAQTDIVMGVSETSKTIAAGASTGVYIITTISPNSCGTPINDTIEFCGSCTKPQIDILTPDTAICVGDTAFVRFKLSGTADYSLYFKLNGIPASVTGITTGYVVIPVDIGVTLTLDSLVDSTCKNDTITNSITITLNDIPTFDLGNDTSICEGNYPFDIMGPIGMNTYTWTPLEVSNTLSVIDSGQVKLLVELNGCTFEDSLSVTTDTLPMVDLGVDTSICTYTTATVNLDAGHAGSTYTWTPGGATQMIDITATGTYDVIVENGNGCIGKDTIIVTINTTPVVDLGADKVICPTSAAITFDAGNVGASYLWSNGETTQTIAKGNGEAGEYSVIVTLNGCEGKDTVALTISTELSVDLGYDKEICTGTKTLLDVGFGAGYNYEWNKGLPSTFQTFESGQGEVIVVVRDAGGCSGADTIQITEVNPLSIDLGLDKEICIGDADVVFSMVSGRTDVTVIGWNDNTTNFTLSTGTTSKYWLDVDSSGCKTSDTVALFVNALPIVDLGSDTFICAGTTPTITLDAGVFVAYQWVDITNMSLLGIVQTQNVSSVGFYGVGVVDANGCVNGDTLGVTQETSTNYILGVDETICPAASETISVPNGMIGGVASWRWINDNSTGVDYVVENQVDGNVINVILEYTNEFGCLSNDTVKITIDNVLPITALRDTLICVGEDVVFQSGYPAGGYSFIWQDGSTGNTFGLTDAIYGDAGVITVDIVSAEGCNGNASKALTVNVNPVPILQDGRFCIGTIDSLDHGLSNVTSLWSPNNEITSMIKITSGGAYSVVVTDNFGCKGVAGATLQSDNPPLLNLGSDVELCKGDLHPLTMALDENNYTAFWTGVISATTGSITAITSGEYKLRVTETATACWVDDTINLLFSDVPNVDLGKDTAICEDDEILTIYSNETNPTYTYLWSTGESVQSIDVSTTGIYSLIVTNVSCVGVDELEFVVNPLPISQLMNDTVVCFEDLPNGLNLDPGRVGVSFNWNTPATTQMVNVNEPGVYIVDVTSTENCTTQDVVTIREDCPVAVWLPSGFTIDGNGLNDNWIIEGRGVTDVEVLVFNRWGELIWTGRGLGDSWDGTFKGNVVQQDVYVYKLTYSYMNINEALISKTRVGTLTVLK